MKLVPPDPVVDLYNEGFENGDQDVLDRRPLGQSLSRLLNAVEDSLVVALDGQWGTGKTYFLKRWVQAHLKDHESATVLYFDAFAHDYRSAPLEALVMAFTERISEGDKTDTIAAVKEAAGKLIKPLTGFVLDAVAPDASKLMEAGGQAFWKAEDEKTVALRSFRESLQSLVAPVGQTGSKLPPVIVIDELDRCRPDYALEMLEVIKHLFTVPHLHFVLGVNLEALEEMVRARYGADIDAQRYLSKFIQVTLELPDEVGPDPHRKKAVLLYLDQLVRTMGIKEHIASRLRQQVEIVAHNTPCRCGILAGLSPLLPWSAMRSWRILRTEAFSRAGSRS
ncbi:MAG: P-loop NTPase fold protein [Rhodobacteraceae bacterium]|nr:P-loop NTPase fold protein [Paracoccaceae bacterium]MCY4328264.1 P-loop NTPase fold protein [Paracoccaceae bacterium]